MNNQEVPFIVSQVFVEAMLPDRFNKYSNINFKHSLKRSDALL